MIFITKDLYSDLNTYIFKPKRVAKKLNHILFPETIVSEVEK